MFILLLLLIRLPTLPAISGLGEGGQPREMRFFLEQMGLAGIERSTIRLFRSELALVCALHACIDEVLPLNLFQPCYLASLLTLSGPDGLLLHFQGPLRIRMHLAPASSVTVSDVSPLALGRSQPLCGPVSMCVGDVKTRPCQEIGLQSTLSKGAVPTQC